MLVQLTVLLLLTVIGSFAQDAQLEPADGLKVRIRPSVRPPPPPLPACYVEKRAPIDTADIARRLNSGQLGPQAPSSRKALSLTLFKCEDGPKQIIHTVSNEFHWPPIYRGSCDNLFCKDPPCIVRKKVWKSKCVFVFKIIHGKWVFIGRQLRRFLDHQECGCKNCGDISSSYQCAATKPCPNSKASNSFCYWTHKCECCTPFKCPLGQVFNSKTCECDCPPGTTKNRHGRCVGDCVGVSVQHCRFVLCEDNQHLKCQVQNYRCACPSCDDVTNTNQCTRTRCLEQKSKPRCKVDPCSKKCRCPNCEEQPDRAWCAKTYCGPNYHLQCRWNPYYHSCSCPH